MFLAYRYRLAPTKGQHRRLRDALEHSRQIYNAALEERIGAYRKAGLSRSFVDQCRGLTELRREPGMDAYPVSLQRYPLKCLDRAMSAFFRRIKRGGKPGFPRFRARDGFTTIGAEQLDGWQVKDGRLIVKGLGPLRLRLHRPLPGDIRGYKIKREGRHWFALFTARVEAPEQVAGSAVGIDLGLSSLAALSTGELVPNPRPYRRSLKRMRVRQRALARARKGSRRRRNTREQLATLHRKIARRRNTYLHQVSARIARRFNLIAVEKLNTAGLANSRLALGVRDASWPRLVAHLRYKAALAGGGLIEVDCRLTSQTCPDCGIIKPKDLTERVHRCPCGCEMDRDVAAAKVVLHRAVHGPGEHKMGGYAVSAPMKAAGQPDRDCTYSLWTGSKPAPSHHSGEGE